MKSLMLTVCSALLLWQPACADEKPNPDKLIPYKTVGDVTLNLHVFEPAEDSRERPCAAIVFFFGGGWKGGTPSQFYSQSRHLADRGMVAICAEYRISSKHGTTPQECVKDGKSAIRWVRKHAEQLGVDPERIAAGGGSAGGHVAAATATVDGFSEESDDSTVSCRPDALVLFNPVYDNGPDGYGYDRVKEYWKSFSPLHNVSDKTPPSIVFLGTKDKLIPAKTGKAWKSANEKVGVRSDLHLYDGLGHGFFNRGESFDDTLNKTDAFLVSLGYLNPTKDQ